MGKAVKVTAEFLAELESGIQGICQNISSAHIGLLTRSGDQIKIRTTLHKSHITGTVFRTDRVPGKYVVEELTAKQLAAAMEDAIKRKSPKVQHDDLDVSMSMSYANSIDRSLFGESQGYELCDVARVIRDWYTRYQERCFSCINFEYPDHYSFKIRVEPSTIRSYLSSAGISAEKLFTEGIPSDTQADVVFTRVSGNLKGKLNENGNRPMTIGTSMVWIEPPKGGKKRKEVEPPTPET